MKKASTSKVAVIIPCNRFDNYLEIAIESALDSDFENIEVILSLDGIAKNRFTELRQYADPRLKILESPGSGIEDALNHAIYNSNADLICRLDSDDLMKSVRISSQVREIEKSNAVLVGSSIYLICPHGSPSGLVTYPKRITNRALLKPFSSRVAHPAVLFKREVFLRVGGYRKGFPAAEDFDLWNRMLEIGDFRNIRKPLTFYRQHSGQISKQKRELQLLSTFEAAKDDLETKCKTSRFRDKRIERFVCSLRRKAFQAFYAGRAELESVMGESSFPKTGSFWCLFRRTVRIFFIPVKYPILAPTIFRAVLLQLFSIAFIKVRCTHC